jgi:UPF0042 nucleotide-binding protein
VADSDKRRLIFVSGLSGAGKSVVLHTLEDLDFYCIDNFPIGLLDKLFEQIQEYPRAIAIGINARNQEHLIPSLPSCMRKFKDCNIDTELVFLEADIDVLKKRYSETRRKHPFSTQNESLHDAIGNEQRLLSVLADIADLKIDTSHTSVHDLRKLINERVVGRKFTSMSIQLVSFGFKYGIPRDADFIFDVRCLPNPYWVSNLRAYSGRDAPVIEYLSQQPLVGKMTSHLGLFVTEWIPFFEEENRSYLTIAVGCTGGRHRSVFIIEQLSKIITALGKQVIIKHRDI